MRNQHGYKWSSDKYRTIKGVKYQQWCVISDCEPEEIQEMKQEAKELGLKIIKRGDELYREVKSE